MRLRIKEPKWYKDQNKNRKVSRPFRYGYCGRFYSVGDEGNFHDSEALRMIKNDIADEVVVKPPRKAKVQKATVKPVAEKAVGVEADGSESSDNPKAKTNKKSVAKKD